MAKISNWPSHFFKLEEAYISKMKQNPFIIEKTIKIISQLIGIKTRIQRVYVIVLNSQQISFHIIQLLLFLAKSKLRSQVEAVVVGVIAIEPVHLGGKLFHFLFHILRVLNYLYKLCQKISNKL